MSAIAERARQILEDELFVSAFAAVENAVVEQMVSTDATDFERIRGLHARLRVVRDVRAAIEAVMVAGDQAKQAREAQRYVV